MTRRGWLAVFAAIGLGIVAQIPDGGMEQSGHPPMRVEPARAAGKPPGTLPGAAAHAVLSVTVSGMT